MANKLGQYNACLRHCGERELASPAEVGESRRVIDQAWDEALAFTLEQGLWNFAIRAVQIDPSDDEENQFGYSFVYDKPTDWIRTVAISADDTFSVPLEDYEDETTYWFADTEPLYVRFVSSDTAFGADLSRWPATFSKYHSLYLASQVCVRLNQNETRAEKLEKLTAKAMFNAKAKDAMNQRVEYPPPGRWIQARSQGNWRGQRYRRA